MSTTVESLAGNADEFPILARHDYFNHAGIGPWPRRAGAALERYAREWPERAIMAGSEFDAVERCRERFARLLNVDPDEVCLAPNTSVGIGTVAAALDWQPGDRVVTAACEYPANLYPWMDAAERKGVELVQVPERELGDGTVAVSEDEVIEAASHARTRLVALSHVQWGSGQLVDVARVGAFCRERGVLFGVDAIQSLGVREVDARAINADFVWAGSHKWLLAPPGGGVFYCRRALIETLRPPVVGWNSTVDSMNWADIDFTLRADAARFEPGSPALPTWVAVDASLALIEEVGVDAIARRQAGLVARFREAIGARGFRVVTPAGERAGPAACFVRDGAKSAELVARLRKEKGIELASRCGRARFSPHFYNTEAQVDRAVEALASLV